MADSLIGSLRVALSLGTAEFEAGANKAVAIARTKSKQIESGFAGAKAAVAGLFSAFAVGFLAEQIKKSLDYAGSLAEVSRTLGVTTKDLQTFRFAATQSGVAQDQLEVGLRRLTVSMGKAELGSKEQAKAFAAIGISVDQLKGKTTGDVFRLMADGLSKVTDRSQRAAIEMTLMGRSGSTLDNLLAPGAKRLNELAAAAEQLGIVLSDDQIQRSEETAHKLEQLKLVLSANIAGVVADNAQSIYDLANALLHLAVSIPKALSGWQKMVAEFKAGVGFLTMGPVGLAFYGQAGDLADNQLDEQRANAKTWAKIKAATSLLGRPATGGDLPKIFAPGAGKPKKPPRDNNEKDLFDAAQQQRQIDLEILSAKQALSHDIGEQAGLALEMLDVQKAIRDAEIDHKQLQAKKDLAEGKITQATYDQIASDTATTKLKENEVDRLKRQAVLDDRDEKLLRQSIDLDTHGYDLRKEQLQKQADLATSMAERREIELQILDLAYREKRIMLDRVINESKNADEVDRARQDRAALDANYQLDRKGVLNQTAGPLEQWAKSIPKSARDINEAFQSIETQGLDGLAQAIAGVVTGTGNLKQAFAGLAKSVIADLVQMSVKMLLFRALTSVFGGSNSGGGGIDLSGYTSLSSSYVPHFASGGAIRIGGLAGTDQNSLAINGMEIARVSRGETLSVDPHGGGRGGDVTVHQTFQFEGVAITEDKFVAGLVQTKFATVAAIREAQRRR